MTRIVLAVAVALLSGCATTFMGSAKVPKGPDGFRAVCAGWGMQLAGMVQLGEYSDGCICEVKKSGPATSSAGASAPSVAGVYMQMMAEAQRQQAQQMQPQVYIPPPVQ